ncbi:NAD-dependent dehydratase [Sulfurifustis variabilis]|uniref:NAD-dependent dehydratase n=1 Tax=Sulfurifustis variabilis TaxID=1675686 RepID=A0A1B4V5A5_9GAMM|nr:SDR family oxidoreductase [Sulfurifustis variabilis]BAU48710.1 NAD-dependent dehydratase [Sulfurifustis variabilis]
MSPVFMVGCGDIGTRVARLERAQRARVSALARSEESAARLRTEGIAPVAGDLDQPESLRELPTHDTLLYYFAPPPAKGVHDPRMRGLLEALLPERRPRRIVYISTTGVYGDCAGAWVTEERPPKPGADRARRRLDAEEALRAFGARFEVGTVILRVPGIYAPGRLPVDRIRAGEPLVREEEAPYTNRIHADDLAQVCIAAMRRGGDGGVYNVSDGHPTTMTDYFFKVADALGLPRPPVLPLASVRERVSEGMRGYLAESRRIDNRRMRAELGVSLRYPTLEAGLAALTTAR